MKFQTHLLDIVQDTLIFPDCAAPPVRLDSKPRRKKPATGLTLKTEISRIDCRLMDRDGIYRHYCTLDRVDADTAQLSGVTFSLTRSLVGTFIEAAKGAGFTYIQYERINPRGKVTRRVKFDLYQQRFVIKGSVEEPNYAQTRQ